LKAYLHKWDQRLDAIVAENTNDQPARSEDDKRRIAVELNGLADDLRQLKRQQQRAFFFVRTPPTTSEINTRTPLINLTSNIAT
jgi:hypothetical protein